MRKEIASLSRAAASSTPPRPREPSSPATPAELDPPRLKRALQSLSLILLGKNNN